MNTLSYRPNLLFFIWIRNKHPLFILNHKLNKQLYYRKLIITLTTKETGINKLVGDFIIWKVNGKFHRDNGPAWIRGVSNETPNGTRHSYYINGIKHRGLFHTGKVEPSYINGISKHNPNGKYNSYYHHGKLHRDGGPAIIYGISTENPNGIENTYYQHGIIHRDNGPARIEGISKINPNGTYHEYYQHGERVDPF